MKIQLLNSSLNSYQLCSSVTELDFRIEDVSHLKIHKKNRFLSFVYYILYIILIYLVFRAYNSLPFTLLFLLTLLLLLFFNSILFKRNYRIDIMIHQERFSIKTKDEKLIQNFLMLENYYNEIKQKL